MRYLKNPETMFQKYINTKGKNLRILGNFDKTKFAMITDEEKAKMTPAEKKAFEKEAQDFFANSRLHGLDNSVELAVGGSDQSIINGFGYDGSTPMSLYLQKAYGKKPFISAKTQKIFDTGHRAEEYIAESFELATGIPVFHWPLQIVNEKYPHCIANVDGIILEKDPKDPKKIKVGIYEGKCPQQFATQKPWKAMAKHGNTPENADLVPIGYRLQVWYYLAVYELDFAYICGGGWGFSSDDIGYCRLERLPEDEEKALMENAETFVTEHCLKKIRPSDIDVRKKESIITAYGDVYSDLTVSKKPVVLDPAYAATFEKALKHKESSDKYKNEIEAIRKKYKAELSEYDACIAALTEACFGSFGGTINHDGNIYTIWTDLGTPKIPIDIDMLEYKYPEIYKEVKQPSVKVNLERLEDEYPTIYEELRRKSTRKLKYSLTKRSS